MPLMLTFEDDAGVIHEDAIIVSQGLAIDWVGRLASLNLGVFSSFRAWGLGKKPITTYSVNFSSTPDELDKTFEDFFTLELLVNPDFNLPQRLELHVSGLSKFAGSVLIPFPKPEELMSLLRL